MRSPLLFLLTGALWLGTLSRGAVAADWEIVRVAGREYLSLENIAAFYQLKGDLTSLDHHLRLTDGRATLEFNGDVRELTVNGVKQWLSFPIVPQGDQYLVSRFDLAKTLEPSLRPAMINHLAPFHTVVIDAGHGGHDRGASSASGFEKDYTLAVVSELKLALEAKGLRVLLTRTDDTFIPLPGRAQRVNDTRDAIFVSVHFNSANDGGAANGFEVFAMTPRGAASTGDPAVRLDQFRGDPGNDFDDASLALATCVHHSLLGHLPETDRGVKRARFAVLRLSRAPAVLVEGGFLSNATESQRINDVAWRKSLAESIAQGIQSFQNLAIHKRPPKLLADYRGERLPLEGTMMDPSAVAARPPAVAPGAIPASNPQPAAGPSR